MVLLGNKSHKNICWEASKTITWQMTVETGAVIYGIIYGGHTNNLDPVNNFFLFNTTTSYDFFPCIDVIFSIYYI